MTDSYPYRGQCDHCKKWTALSVPVEHLDALKKRSAKEALLGLAKHIRIAANQKSYTAEFIAGLLENEALIYSEKEKEAKQKQLKFDFEK